MGNPVKYCAYRNYIRHHCRETHGCNGARVFGDYSIADTMYAPVVLRVNTHGITVCGAANRFIEIVLQQQEIKEWLAACNVESGSLIDQGLSENMNRVLDLNCWGSAARLVVRSAVLASLLIIAGCSKSTPPVEFIVQTDDGQMPISKFRGEVVYLDFWATWCGPCRDSFPWMKEMQTKYKDKGLKVVAVSLDTDHALARQFADELSSNFIIGYDDTGTIANQFKVIGMPTSVIIDRDGVVAEVHQGFKLDQVDVYEKSLVKVLN